MAKGKRSFVDATGIAERLSSPRRDAQELLPQLVEKLVKASLAAEEIHRIRFPHGDAIYLHGGDGVLAVGPGVLHRLVPDGFSFWEMGTDADPRSKASSDFPKSERKLADAFPGMEVTPEKATFVFVTSKPWESGAWIREKRATSKWKDIRVIDAVGLEGWLELCPAVMLWFAECCGIPAAGLWDAEQLLRKHAVAYGLDGLPPELVIAGRKEAEEDLVRQLRDGTGDVQVQGESSEEAAAFVAAVLLSNEPGLTDASHFVFADSQGDLALLGSLSTDPVVIPLDSEAEARARQTSRWRLITPKAGNAVPAARAQASVVELGRCTRDALEKCLTDGLGFAAHEAKKIARDCKGSLSAILWLAGAGPLGEPRWAARKDATTHASLVLPLLELDSRSPMSKVLPPDHKRSPA